MFERMQKRPLYRSRWLAGNRNYLSCLSGFVIETGAWKCRETNARRGKVWRGNRVVVRKIQDHHHGSGGRERANTPDSCTEPAGRRRGLATFNGTKAPPMSKSEPTRWSAMQSAVLKTAARPAFQPPRGSNRYWWRAASGVGDYFAVAFDGSGGDAGLTNLASSTGTFWLTSLT